MSPRAPAAHSLPGLILPGLILLGLILLGLAAALAVHLAITLTRAHGVTGRILAENAQLKARLTASPERALPVPARLGEARLSAELTPLEALPKAWLDELLEVEDPGFWGHRGLDFSTPGQGMTTLPQALVKRLYFHDFRPGWLAKLDQDLITALELEPRLSKTDQLQMFLNTAWFGTVRGRPVIGFGEAARAYFHKPLEALGDGEFLALVAMLMAPDALDPARHGPANAQRVARIRRLLAGDCRPRDLRDVTYCDCAPGRGG